MAYGVASGDIMLMVIKGTCFSQTVMLTHHYRLDIPGVADGLTVLEEAAAVLNALNGVCEDYARSTPVSLVNLELQLQWVYPNRFRKVEFPCILNAGQLPTSQVCNLTGAVTLTGDAANRRGRGTKHILLPAEASFEGVLEEAHKTVLNRLGTELSRVVSVTAGNLIPVLFGGPTPPGIAITRDVTGHDVGDTVRVQRWRTVGLGS